jgi:hypothetical protein
VLLPPAMRVHGRPSPDPCRGVAAAAVAATSCHPPPACPPLPCSFPAAAASLACPRTFACTSRNRLQPTHNRSTPSAPPRRLCSRQRRRQRRHLPEPRRPGRLLLRLPALPSPRRVALLGGMHVCLLLVVSPQLRDVFVGCVCLLLVVVPWSRDAFACCWSLRPSCSCVCGGGGGVGGAGERELCGGSHAAGHLSSSIHLPSVPCLVQESPPR